jgi:hypothetical protein
MLPSQITAGALSTLCILGVQMLVSLGVFVLTADQLRDVSAFVVAASNMGFGTLLWYVNRANPNPSAPGS